MTDTTVDLYFVTKGEQNYYKGAHLRIRDKIGEYPLFIWVLDHWGNETMVERAKFADSAVAGALAAIIDKKWMEVSHDEYIAFRVGLVKGTK